MTNYFYYKNTRYDLGDVELIREIQQRNGFAYFNVQFNKPFNYHYSGGGNYYLEIEADDENYQNTIIEKRDKLIQLWEAYKQTIIEI